VKKLYDNISELFYRAALLKTDESSKLVDLFNTLAQVGPEGRLWCQQMAWRCRSITPFVAVPS
jgi:hypothetical protein